MANKRIEGRQVEPSKDVPKMGIGGSVGSVNVSSMFTFPNKHDAYELNDSRIRKNNSSRSGSDSVRTMATTLLNESDLDDATSHDNLAYESSGDTDDTSYQEIGSYGTVINSQASVGNTSQTTILRKPTIDVKPKKKKRKRIRSDSIGSGGDGAPEAEMKELWNVFGQKPTESDAYSYDECIKKGKIMIKLTFGFFAMLFVLMGGIISKMSLLYIASNANPYVGFHRSVFNMSGDPVYTFACSADGTPCPTEKETQCSLPLCLSTQDDQRRAAVRWIWALLLCLCIPYLKTFFLCLQNVMFKTKRAPTMNAVIFVCVMETLHSAGIFLLLFTILPFIDSYRGIFLMNGVFLIPALLMMTIFPKRSDSAEHDKSTFTIILDLFNFVVQLGALGACIATYMTIENEQALECAIINQATPPESFIGTLPTNIGSFSNMYLIPVALFLISFVHWDNFVDSSIGLGIVGEGLYIIHKAVRKCRTKLYLFIAVWKMILSFGFLMIYWYILSSSDSSNNYSDFTYLFNSNGSESAFRDPNTGQFHMDWIYMTLIQVIPGIIVYWVTDVVVKSKVQLVSFSLPVTLTTPCTFAFLCMVCLDCFGSGVRLTFGDLYWNCFGGYNTIEDLWWSTYFGVGFVIWISQLWLGRHIWFPETEKLAKSEKIFSNPTYCGCLLEQSLIFNRRRNDTEFSRTENTKMPKLQNQRSSPEDCRENPDPLFSRVNSDREPYIFCCATMWHETEQEMINILTSIYRLDFDQCARKNAQDHFKIKDTDFYQFEAHVFFDDAYKSHTLGEHNYTVNTFVKQLHKVMGKAAEGVHNVIIKVDDPDKYPTPYGGRLEYRLPGGNMLTVHMKDKQKIRHRKRWSQVMYMYYLLGHRLWSEDEKRGRKEIIAHNTYLLALDGDVDFKPEAVTLLVDLMKRNEKVGAACGRIHPMGSGPMVWYQQFEYAVSHWLQKSTEHILGCVLCSPGCFSLFRGSALMDDNVMKTYSKRPTEALDHVQYDQGEDRWLCTLLLQQGYRVEYAAASDAFTFAPESFNEFFNQRKRWTPSTFANILDLLRSGRATVKKNDNISMLYIVYQAVLFISSVIGPGTIFLLITGALQQLLDQPQGICFIIVAIPITAFFILTFVAKADTQLLVALLLSGLLMAVMMVVIVTVLVDIAEGGLCEPGSIFVIFVFFVFVIAALIHPQEMKTIIFLPLYFLMIPTMYVVLIIYAMTNMHDISWGTREVPKTEEEKKKDKMVADEFAAKEAASKTKSAPVQSILAMFGLAGTESKGDKDGWTMSLGDCCSFTCCLRPGESITDQKITKLSEEVQSLTKELKKSTGPRNVHFSQDDNVDEDDKPSTSKAFRKGSVRVQDTKIAEQLKEEEKKEELKEARKKDAMIKKQTAEDEAYDLRDPFWINDDDLGKGPRRQLSHAEISFWKGLILEYLYPLEMSSEHKRTLAKDLKDLRNKTVAGFFVLDILLIVFIQALYLFIDADSGEGPLIPYNCTDPLTGVNKIYYFEPIGLMFLSVFGAVTIIQLVGMFAHRWFSLMQIVSMTTIRRPHHLDDVSTSISVQQAVDIAKDMIKINDIEDTISIDTYDDEQVNAAESTDDDGDNIPSRTHKKSKYLKRGQTQKKSIRKPVGPANIKTLDQAFAVRFLKLKQELDSAKTEMRSRDSDIYTSVRDPEDVEEGGSQIGEMQTRPTAAKRFQSMFRRKTMNRSVHQRAVQNFMQNNVFTDAAGDQMRQRYNIQDEDIAKYNLNSNMREAAETARNSRLLNGSSVRHANGQDMEMARM